MKKILLTILSGILLALHATAQHSFHLSESTWIGNHSPTVQGSKMLFLGDTMAFFELDGIREPEVFTYIERQDTLEIRALESASISCTDQGPGRYLLIRSNNGERIHFKPISDACMSRFTKLVAESPWTRKRETGEWRPDWHFLSPENDHTAGIGLYEAYRLLRFKKPQPITVAVIDCPVDYTHTDLSSVMWKNPKEIPDNQKDEDKNWFRDDVRGWYFNCSKDGIPVAIDQPEATQVYQQFSRQFEGRDEKSLKPEEKRDWQTYQKAKSIFMKEQNKANYLKIFYSDSARLFSTLNDFLLQSEKPVTATQIDSWKTSDPNYANAVKSVLKESMLNRGYTLDRFIRNLKTEFSMRKKQSERLWICDYNPECYPRAPIMDHPENPNEKMYGCGFLKNPDSEENGHGTHCAGIIAGKRENGQGIDGIASQAKIMSLSVVPSEGDERDKDVANAIRYAADKGAKIISMSFAKRLSPHKKTVDDAVKYAESKGCLLFHASGNNHLDRDTAVFYPNPQYQGGGRASNWIEVGNNTAPLDENLAAPSSNYGKKTVDLFAPGTDILSTYPGNMYETMTGTSMACPVAAGVAAMIWSYFPKFSAGEIRKILLESVYKPDVKVLKPGTQEMVPFSSLTVSGGIVNARQAAVMAEKLYHSK